MEHKSSPWSNEWQELAMGKKEKSKWEQIIQHHDICMFQEAHGDYGSVARLAHRLRGTHIVIYDFHNSHGTGGVITTIAHRVLNGPTSVEVEWIDQGRIHGVNITDDEGTMNVGNLHIDPKYSNTVKTRKLRTLMQFMRGSKLERMHGYFGGDFNFNESGEQNVNSFEMDVHTQPGIARAWDYICQDICELLLEDFTRHEGSSWSRLDRLFTTLPTTIPIDLKPIVKLLR